MRPNIWALSLVMSLPSLGLAQAPCPAEPFIAAVDDSAYLHIVRWDTAAGAFGPMQSLSPAQAGIARGVVIADFDDDGDQDIIVTIGSGNTYRP